MKKTFRQKVFVAFIPIWALIVMVITHEVAPHFLPSYKGPESVYNYFFMVAVAILLVAIRWKVIKRVMKIN